VIAGERTLAVQTIDERESLLGPLAHRDGDGPVEVDDRRGCDGGQVCVQRHDRPPVGVGRLRGPDVLAGDRRLEAVRPDPSRLGGTGEHDLALGDQIRVPQPPVLVVEQDRHPVGPDPRGRARVMEEHQGGEPRRLGLPGKKGCQDAGEAERLTAQVVPHG
jgi:hypothetical protein